MKNGTPPMSITFRVMILLLCSVLFMPVKGQTSSLKEIDSFRMSTLTLAISGISNPLSHLKNPGDTVSPHTPGKRQQDMSPASDNSSTFAALSTVFSLPVAAFSVLAPFLSLIAPPKSHGRIHWFALAPPLQQNV